MGSSGGHAVRCSWRCTTPTIKPPTYVHPSRSDPATWPETPEGVSIGHSQPVAQPVAHTVAHTVACVPVIGQDASPADAGSLVAGGWWLVTTIWAAQSSGFRVRQLGEMSWIQHRAPSHVGRTINDMTGAIADLPGSPTTELSGRCRTTWLLALAHVSQGSQRLTSPRRSPGRATPSTGSGTTAGRTLLPGGPRCRCTPCDPPRGASAMGPPVGFPRFKSRDRSKPSVTFVESAHPPGQEGGRR